MDANSVLIDVLNIYAADYETDFPGDATPVINAVSKCKDYLSHNTVTTDWLKRNWVIMAPAVKNYRKYLVDDLHHARIIEDKESLAELYAEYDILAPYIQLFKAFPKFLQ